MAKAKSIHPTDCGCTSCIVGESEPLCPPSDIIGRAEQAKRVMEGHAYNYTGKNAKKVTVYEWE